MKKKLIICISVLYFISPIFAQEMSNIAAVSSSKSISQFDNNELRFNLATSIGGLPEFSYERFFYDNMGLGLSLAVSLESSDDQNIRSIILPYYRIYFGKKKAAGFFIEGNMAIVGQKGIIDYYEYSSSQYPYQNNFRSFESTNFGFGAAIGVKLLTRNNFVGELVMGVGRLLGKPEVAAYPRMGICIGKRF